MLENGIHICIQPYVVFVSGMNIPTLPAALYGANLATFYIKVYLHS